MIICCDDYMEGFLNSYLMISCIRSRPLKKLEIMNENTLYWNLLLHCDIKTSMEISEIFYHVLKNEQQKSEETPHVEGKKVNKMNLAQEKSMN